MKKILILIIPFVMSCHAVKVNEHQCNENLEFKQLFFYHVKYIDDNIGVLQDSKFRESVIFISNYAPLSVNSIMNYASTYPIGKYREDRVIWLKWYEDNKCRNIQFKSTYIIPDAYKD